MFFMYIDAEILKNMFTKQIQQHKNVIHYNQLGFVLGMQDWFNIWKLVLILNILIE